MRMSFVLRAVFAAAFLAAAVLFVTGCAGGTPAVTGLPATVLLGSQLGHMTAEVEINGQRMTFVIDTGATSCLISTKAAARAGLSVEGAESVGVRDPSGQKTPVPTIRVPEVRLLAESAASQTFPSGSASTLPAPASSQVAFKDISFYVVGPPGFQRGYDGVIGLSLLQHAVFRFDVPRGVMRITHDTTGSDGWIPLKLKHGGLFADLQTPAGPMPALIDSGNGNFSWVSEAAGSKIGYAAPPTTVGVSMGFFRRFEIRAARASGDLILGPLHIVRPLVAVMSDPLMPITIGNSVLQNYAWELDVRGRRMRFVGPTPPFRQDAAMVWGCYVEGEPYCVTWLMPGGNAELAGLRLDDEVLSTGPADSEGAKQVVVRRGEGQITLSIRETRLLANP